MFRLVSKESERLEPENNLNSTKLKLTSKISKMKIPFLSTDGKKNIL